MHTVTVRLISTLLVLLPVVVHAQTPAPDTPRDRMRTFLVLRLADALDLPDEKALEVSRILRDAEQKRRQLLTQRRDVERAMRAALQQTPPDQTAIAALVKQANEIDGQVAMIPENSFRAVQNILTVEQQGRLVLLRPEIQGQIRRNVERRLRERITR